MRVGSAPRVSIKCSTAALKCFKILPTPEKAYLVGLGATDDPASLYAQKINFSKGDQANQPIQQFSITEPFQIQSTSSETQDISQFKSWLTNLFNTSTQPNHTMSEINKTQPSELEQFNQRLTTIETKLAEFSRQNNAQPTEPANQDNEQFTKLETSINKLTEQFSQLTEKLNQPLGSQKPPADGHVNSSKGY